MQWLTLIDSIATGVFLFWGVIVRGVFLFSVRGSLLWWIAADVYFELRPLVLPYIAFDAVVDVMQNDNKWVLGVDVLGIFVWNWLIKNDPPDPRDRWGKRKKALKRLVTPAKKLVPVKVGR